MGWYGERAGTHRLIFRVCISLGGGLAGQSHAPQTNTILPDLAENSALPLALSAGQAVLGRGSLPPSQALLDMPKQTHTPFRLKYFQLAFFKCIPSRNTTLSFLPGDRDFMGSNH